MSTKPGIDERAVLEALSRSYGMRFERIVFMTTGWASFIYKVDTADGQPYLLKLYDESLPEPMVATSRDFYLSVTHQLRFKGLLPNIACPVQRPDGSYLLRMGRYVLIVFHYIEGTVVGFGDLPPDVLEKLSVMVGRLHRRTAFLDLPANPLIEDFRIAFQDALPAALDALGK